MVTDVLGDVAVHTGARGPQLMLPKLALNRLEARLRSIACPSATVATYQGASCGTFCDQRTA